MRNLAELKADISNQAIPAASAILIYGGPRTGKSLLASTIAKATWIKRVYWFDLEKGLDTLIFANKTNTPNYLCLTEEELGKIIPINVIDGLNPGETVAAETLLKVFTSKKPLHVSQKTGKVVPLPNEDTVEINYKALDASDAIVIDSGSQLSDSIVAMTEHELQEKQKGDKDVHGMLVYLAATEHMNALMSSIQAAKTNIIMVTHQYEIQNQDESGSTLLPLFGSKNYVHKVAKYFGQIVYTSIALGKHRVGSASTYKSGVSTGSRTHVALEKEREPNINTLLTGGLLNVETKIDPPSQLQSTTLVGKNNDRLR